MQLKNVSKQEIIKHLNVKRKLNIVMLYKLNFGEINIFFIYYNIE